METELTVPAAKDFVSENGELFIVVITMESDCKFALISVGLGTGNKLTSDDDEIMSIDCHVDFVAELDFAFHDN